MERAIYLTQQDLERLTRLVDAHSSDAKADHANLARLEAELERAEIVAPEEIPADVVTMNSRVRTRDLDTGQEMVFSLVYPRDADIKSQKISILAPIGTGVLGYRVGDTIEWPVPSGTRRLIVEEVLYQPEAAGDFEL